MSNTNNPTTHYDFATVETALVKLGATIHRADGETRQSFIDLVETIKRWRDATADDGR
jgi:hypothetical protein